MAKYRRSKYNGTTMMEIPKPETVQVQQEQESGKLLNLLKSKYNLKQKRLTFVEQKAELHQKIYNLSVEISCIEEEIDQEVMKRM